MTEITFAVEDAPEKVTRPHKYDGVVKQLADAEEGKQVGATFPDEASVESFLNAVRSLANAAGFSVRTSEKKVNEDGTIKLGIIRVPRRTRRTSEEVAAEKAQKAADEAAAAADAAKPKGKK